MCVWDTTRTILKSEKQKQTNFFFLSYLGDRSPSQKIEMETAKSPTPKPKWKQQSHQRQNRNGNNRVANAEIEMETTKMSTRQR